jgi:hypothetical protein
MRSERPIGQKRSRAGYRKHHAPTFLVFQFPMIKFISSNFTIFLAMPPAC